MKTFSEKFEQNANLQLRKVTRAIDLYVKNVYIKSRLVRYVNSQNGFGMMQPLALKNFSDVVYSYLEPIIGSDNISMFTVVVDKYNFGQDNWNFQYKSFQKKIKKIFKGYDYIANFRKVRNGTTVVVVTVTAAKETAADVITARQAKRLFSAKAKNMFSVSLNKLTISSD